MNRPSRKDDFEQLDVPSSEAIKNSEWREISEERQSQEVKANVGDKVVTDTHISHLKVVENSELKVVDERSKETQTMDNHINEERNYERNWEQIYYSDTSSRARHDIIVQHNESTMNSH